MIELTMIELANNLFKRDKPPILKCGPLTKRVCLAYKNDVELLLLKMFAKLSIRTVGLLKLI